MNSNEIQLEKLPQSNEEESNKNGNLPEGNVSSENDVSHSGADLEN